MNCGTYRPGRSSPYPSFASGNLRKCSYKAFAIHPEANSGMVFQADMKLFPMNFLTKTKGKDHAYLDK